MFFKIDVIKSLQYSLGNTCFVLGNTYFNKVVGYQACNFIKKRLQHKCVPVTLATFLRTTFFTEHLRWLLLSIDYVNIYLFSIFFSIDFAWLPRTLLTSWFINFKKSLKRFHSMYKWSQNKDHIILMFQVVWISKVILKVQNLLSL